MEKNLLENLEAWLERMDRLKDERLFTFIKTYWPRRITPNHLTFARIIIGLALFVLLFNFRNDNGYFILPLFFIGILSDFLDGPIARGLNMKTRTGEIMDPIADRVLIIPVAFYSLIDFTWLLFSIIFLEILNALISVISHGKNIFFGSNIFGKTKMVMQSLVLIAILLVWPEPPSLFFRGILWASIALMAVSVAQKIVRLRLYYAHKED